MSQPAADTFPCKNCGAKLTFDASVQAMACPYCGHKEAVAPPPQQQQPQQQGYGGGYGQPQQQQQGGIREIPIEEGMQLAQRGLGTQVTTISCKECGATVNVGQGERTTACAFCGSKQVLSQATNEQAIRPESLLPFRIAKEDANKRFGQWLSGLWFRPNDLKKMASVQEMGGVYVPFWTFDSHVSSYWTAERGWHYYESETYHEYVNGQRVTRTRQVQRTRWESASGQRRDFFDDVLVCAGKGLPGELVDKFSTFDTKQLQPYRPEFLAGWRAEAYAVDLMPGWGVAQQKMARVQEGRCGGDVGGDTHRSLNVNNQYAGVTFKHVLLPIWIAAYRYNGKAFRFLVNGQSGEVVGVAPWSVWKITLAVLAGLIVIGGIITAVVLTQDDNQRPSMTTTPETPAMTATNAAPTAPAAVPTVAPTHSAAPHPSGAPHVTPSPSHNPAPSPSHNPTPTPSSAPSHNPTPAPSHTPSPPHSAAH